MIVRFERINSNATVLILNNWRENLVLASFDYPKVNRGRQNEQCWIAQTQLLGFVVAAAVVLSSGSINNNNKKQSVGKEHQPHANAMIEGGTLEQTVSLFFAFNCGLFLVAWPSLISIGSFRYSDCPRSS